MNAKKLTVKMFGGFTARYGDEVLTFGRQRNSKYEQLFHMLMIRPGQELSKERIAEDLYEREKVEDLNASLNNTIFRLRKYLKESPLPPGEYVILEAGAVRFGGEIEVESDVWDFENAIREFEEEQDRRRKASVCEKACELYRGEFLPQLSNEQWVIEISRNYQERYSEMLEYLLAYLKEEGDYDKMEKMALRAANISSYEGWEIWQVDSLIALGHHKEAREIYQKIVERAQETGSFLSKKQRERFREIGVRLRQPEGTEEDISKCLMDSVYTEGAYGCTFLGFLDCFRMLKRTLARRGTAFFGLFLCTILDANGRPSRDSSYCEKQGERLRKTFQNCLRKGDIYARYSAGQYLLLCIGAKGENVREIGARIDMDFRKRCGGRGEIRCTLLDDGNIW